METHFFMLYIVAESYSFPLFTSADKASYWVLHNDFISTLCVSPTCSVAVLRIGIGKVFSECSGCSVETTRAAVNPEPYCTTAIVKHRVVTHKESQDSLHINSLSELFIYKVSSWVTLHATSQVDYTTTAVCNRQFYC